ncbi:sensor histidine kinase [Pontibacillus halophilus JSM 076056 = DSM 19796]|uniref:Heme sensor protein HssS n=1 Tax=Pontibacillus halophilus JSM 076056 = DSM 19796 TaxID=1385510 RepID=A0A0A5GJI1_9BACI|nr:HAMP domain-containing sensor histidine kinase [Pontibacillus halophilus]KGX91373.1 sensor histidine kinase [Pontibacillus halophilus JSM 076056 = DSM 19796]
MKSLYVQIVVTFFGAILISLIITFLISGRLHALQVAERLEDRMVTVGKDFIGLYKDDPSIDVEVYLDAMSSLSFDVLLFKEDSTTRLYENPEEEWEITDDNVDKVLGGGVFKQYKLPPRLMIGLPFESEGQSHALFLRPNFDFFFVDFRKLIIILFLTILVIGSFIFILTTRWTVRPIKEMTRSAEQLAKGNFNVEIESKRKDELGSLARSFNDMAHGLGELDGMRQQFVSNVSHEIQSPLTSIQGFARALRDGVVKDESSRDEYLTIIEQESKRLSVLSQNLLKLATLDLDHPPFEPVSYSLGEQIRRVLASLEPQWSSKDIEMKVHIDEGDFIGDQHQLEQVWINLLSNAIRHTEEEGIIVVSLRYEEDKAIVSLQDSGEGISEEDQQRIFERFYKVDKARTRKEGGNGLGLSIANKIVQLHGGEITVKSEPGRGATFSVALPKYQTSASLKLEK